tara:strand:+ start:1946 stop:2575 length:630 start_codon:yes stop_codon:yes gene_type:complete
MARSRTLNQKHSLTQDIHEYGINFDTREIFLHSHYSSEEESGVDYRSAVKFQKNLSILNSFSSSDITVNMHIIGGHWHDGMAMYDCIKISRSRVTIKGFGHVGSMSSIVLQAGSKRLLSASCEFLVHFGSIGLETNSMAAKSMIEWNEKCNSVMLDIYSQRCQGSQAFGSKPVSYIKNYIKTKIKNTQEWFMTAEEAVHYGFADGIIEE